MVTIIDLLRHGEPEGGLRYRGQRDDPLTELGWQQMRAVVPEQPPWQQIITSPLLRCSEFAEALTRQMVMPLAYEPRLIEIDFGDWEGQTAAQLEHSKKEQFYAFYDDPVANTPPNAESLLAFQQRVLTAWEDILFQYQQRHCLLIVHAGVIRIILAEVLSMPLEAMFRLQVPLASLSRIVVHGYGAKASMQLQFHAGKI